MYVVSACVYKKVEGGNGRRTTVPSSSIIQVGRLLPATLETLVHDKAMRQVLKMPGAKRNVTTMGPLPRPVHVGPVGRAGDLGQITKTEYQRED